MSFKIKYIFDLVDKISPKLKKINKNISDFTQKAKKDINKNIPKLTIKDNIPSELRKSKKKIDNFLIATQKSMDSKILELKLKDSTSSGLKSAKKKIDNFSRETSSSLRRVQNNFAQMGRNINRSGRNLFTKITLPTGLATGASLLAESSLDSIKATLGSVLGRFTKGQSIEVAVGNEIEYLRKVADQLGISFQDVIGPYTHYLAASNDNLEVSRKTISSFLGIGRALGVTQGDMSRIIRAIEQMQSKGKVMAEELKLQLGDVLPGSTKLFADAAKITTEQLLDLMAEGRISAKILEKVADVIKNRYSKAIKEGADTLKGSLGRMSSSIFFLRSSIGDAINNSFLINEKINSISKTINKLTEKFNKLSPSTKDFLIVLTALIIILPIIAIAISAVALAIAFLLTPVGFISTAIILLTSYLVTFSEKSRTVGKVILMALGTPLYKFIDILYSFGETVINVFKDIWNYLSEIGSKTYDMITAPFIKAANKIKSIFTPIKNFLIEGLMDSEDKITQMYSVEIEKGSNLAKAQNNKIGGKLDINFSNMPIGTSSVFTPVKESKLPTYINSVYAGR